MNSPAALKNRYAVGHNNSVGIQWDTSEWTTGGFKTYCCIAAAAAKTLDGSLEDLNAVPVKAIFQRSQQRDLEAERARHFKAARYAGYHPFSGKPSALLPYPAAI